MPSRYNLPHIDLSSRAQSAPYTSTDSNPVGAGTDRIREQHGARLRRELAAAYEAFEAQREINQRLGEPEGVFLEVELRTGFPSIAETPTGPARTTRFPRNSSTAAAFE